MAISKFARLFGILITTTIKMLSYLPQGLLRQFEALFAKAQGKGLGTSTIALEISSIGRLITQNRNFEPRVVFDIGANTGEWTEHCLAAFPNCAVWAFEPSMGAWMSLSERFERNLRVEIHRLGISDQAGSSILYKNSELSGLSSLSKRRLTHFGIDLNNEEQIELTTLDDFCLQRNLWPEIIKLDIEGHELSALRGGMSALSKARIVQFEFGGANLDSRTNFQDFYYFFKERGFSIFRITPSGNYRITKYSEWDEVFLTTNFLALRDD